MINRVRLIFLFSIFSLWAVHNSALIGELRFLENIASFRENPLRWKKSLRKLQVQFGLKADQFVILVSISKQKLYLIKGGKVVKIYLVSTSKYGIGNEEGSNKTPLGTHCICEKIGKNAKIGTIFKMGINTRRIAEIYIDSTDLEEDPITTRIMWLEGLEAGINRGKGIDSYKRHIYIHGTPEEGLIGQPASHGCIRMRNKDVVELFNLVSKGTLVEVQE